MTARMALLVMSEPHDGPMSLSCTSLGETSAILARASVTAATWLVSPVSLAGASTLTVRLPGLGVGQDQDGGLAEAGHGVADDVAGRRRPRRRTAPPRRCRP